MSVCCSETKHVSATGKKLISRAKNFELLSKNWLRWSSGSILLSKCSTLHGTAQLFHWLSYILIGCWVPKSTMKDRHFSRAWLLSNGCEKSRKESRYALKRKLPTVTTRTQAIPMKTTKNDKKKLLNNKGWRKCLQVFLVFHPQRNLHYSWQKSTKHTPASCNYLKRQLGKLHSDKRLIKNARPLEPNKLFLVAQHGAYLSVSAKSQRPEVVLFASFFIPVSFFLAIARLFST